MKEKNNKERGVNDMNKYEEVNANLKKQIELLKDIENLVSKSNATNRQKTFDCVQAFRQDIEKAQISYERYIRQNELGGTYNYEKDF